MENKFESQCWVFTPCCFYEINQRFTTDPLHPFQEQLQTPIPGNGLGFWTALKTGFGMFGNRHFAKFRNFFHNGVIY